MRQNYDTPSITEALITYPYGHPAMTGHGPTATRFLLFLLSGKFAWMSDLL